MSSTKQTYVAVVDDDEKLCQSFGRLLRAAGLQPITYPSAEAFLADTKQPRFDCLVLDVQLEGMSGIELAQRLTAEGAPPPFIFITPQESCPPSEYARSPTTNHPAAFSRQENKQVVRRNHKNHVHPIVKNI